MIGEVKNTMNDRRGYIYVIINKINGKYYYGKTFNVKARWKKHIINATDKINRRLYDAMNCYGYNNFSIHVIKEILEPKKTITNKLNELETYFIKFSESQNPLYGYNMTDGGDGGNCGEEGIQKMILKKTGVPLSEEHKKKIGKGNIGKNVGNHLTKEHKQYLRSLYEGKTYEELHGIEEANRIKKQKSKALKGKKRKPFSQEWKNNISKAGKGVSWNEKVGEQRANELKQKHANRMKGNQINLKAIDINLVESLLKEGKHFKQIAKILNISTTTLNYKFREKYNMTPYQYSLNFKN